MRTTMIAVFALFVAASAHAQSLSEIAPYVAVAIGSYADWKTTDDALATGRFHEGQPTVYRQDMKTIAILKVSQVVTVVSIMWALRKTGHTKAAKFVGYMDGGVAGGAAVSNWRLLRNYKVAH